MGSGTYFDWAAPQFQNSSYMKFETVGDSIDGVIVGMSSKTFPGRGVPGEKDYEPDKTYPVLALDTARGEIEVTVSNVDLLAKTKAANPQIGDWYSAGYVALAGKKKIFVVSVKKAPSDGQPLTDAQRAAAEGRHYPAVDVETRDERAAKASDGPVPF